jgi:glycosyltransferase involved in cell wall biosynthesis
MRVCLDARKLWDSGIGTYIQGLFDGFTKIEHEVKWDFILSTAEHKDEVELFARSIRYSKAKNYSISELFDISRLVNQTGSDLFHAPHYVLPLNVKPAAIVTVHDIIHLRFPDYFSPLQRSYARWMLNRVKNKAAMVLTVSETTKRDLITELGFSEEKIMVTYPGVGERFFNPVQKDTIAEFCLKSGLPQDYLLYVGNLKPHKNVNGLIDGWAKLNNSIRPPLVIVGSGERYLKYLLKRAGKLGLSGEVFFPGRIANDDMTALYQGALGCVQPSWYEGFGSPPVEAMASGVPLAISNRGSLPEVTGDAAVVFNPAKVDEMISVLERLLTDTVLRTDLIQKGRQRAARYRWEKTAEGTLQAYKTALEGR